jgi:protein CpxP
MKKQFCLATISLLMIVATVKAQNGGYQHMTVQERVTTTVSKLADLKLDSATTVKADTIFTDFYTAQQQLMQNMMSGGDQVDRTAMRAQRQQLADDRDGKLKLIFTSDQYTKWENDIEPSLHPQRGNR